MELEIISIRSFAPTVPIKAVYLEDDSTLTRIPVIIIQEKVWGRRGLPDHSEFVLMDGTTDGDIDYCSGCSNFIGFEYNNEEQNWEEELKGRQRIR